LSGYLLAVTIFMRSQPTPYYFQAYRYEKEV
jgi:hypothetical protein